MLIDSYLWVFVPAITLLTLTPGVDSLLVVRNTARGGWRDGAATSLGICCGLFVHAALSALGLSLIIARSPALFELVRLAGAAYLVWLGLKSLRAVGRPAAGPAAPPAGGRPNLRVSLLEGLLSNVLNPKAILFYMAFLPQFIFPGENALAKSLFLAAIHFVIANAWQLGLVLFTDRARHWLAQPGAGGWFHGLAGVLLVGLGFRLLLQG